MEETKEQQSLHRFLQFAIYLSVLIEIFLFFYADKLISQGGVDKYNLRLFAIKLARIPFYNELFYSKLFTLLLICLVSVGTLSRKKKDLNPKHHIAYPLSAGIFIFFSGIWFHSKTSPLDTSWFDLVYIISAFLGTILIHVAMDNVSKMISSRLGKDKWNVEGESFIQPTKRIDTPSSVNIPMQFYYKGKVWDGWLNLTNIYRAVLNIGVPGSGKTFGLINPAIRQLIGKEFCACVYDYKFPDLGQIAYYHYLLAKQNGKCTAHTFHVVNLNQVEQSRRINPWRSDYMQTLAEASESAEGLVEALKKGDKSQGSDQFFTQSAINFLAACIYFFSKYEGGKYSSFPHVLSFLNCSYDEIFSALFSEPELASLLSPFRSAYQAKAFDQLEGQVGTLKIFISRLATKETFWVFSGDDFSLKISDRESPAILVLANDPNTQNINSACYSIVLNRITKLMNRKGNLPSVLIIDEVPTLYIHKIENLIAVARSNKLGIILGLQELPQFRQQYGKDTATTITSVVGNVLAGSARNKETLDWLERLFGKVKQQSESLSIDRNKTSVSLSERLEPLIPAGKIAALRAGEMVGILATDAIANYTGKFETSAVNCRINLDMAAIEKEEQNYRPLPIYYDFKGKKDEVLRENFHKINLEVLQIVKHFKSPQPVVTEPQPKGMMKPIFKK